LKPLPEAATILFDSGRVVTARFPEVNHLVNLQLTLEGTLNITGAATSVTNPWELIDVVEIVTGNGDVIKRFKPAMMRRQNNNLYVGAAPEATLAVGVAAYTLHSAIIVPMTLAETDWKGLYNLYRCKAPQIVVHWRTLAALVTGGTAALAADVALRVMPLLWVGGEFEARTVAESLDDIWYVHQTYDVAITAAGEVRLSLPKGHQLRDLTLLATNNGIPSDALITRLQLAANGRVYQEWSGLQGIQDRYAILRNTARETGWAVINLDEFEARSGWGNSYDPETGGVYQQELVATVIAPTPPANISVMAGLVRAAAW
jgi:hypothetical protein